MTKKRSVFASVILMAVLSVPVLGQEYGQRTTDQQNQSGQSQDQNQNQGSQTQDPNQQGGQNTNDPSANPNTPSQGQDTQDTQGTQGTSEGQATTQQGQTTGDAGSQSAWDNKKGQDWKFLNKAAMSGMLEVKLGQLAVERASSQAVKDFGKKMVEQHSQANQELMSIAQAKGVTLGQTADPKHQKVYDKLAEKNGVEFDEAYMKQMEKEHKRDVKEFEKQAEKGEDSDLRQFASKHLPHLREHLELASSTRDQVEGTQQAE